MAAKAKRALLLSVGYGQGHHAAAHALEEEMLLRGWSARVADPCAMAYPRLFGLTRRFYRLCVRRAPWLWGVTYAQTDTADWAGMVHMPLLAGCMRQVRVLSEEFRPDVILCTYPLYAYMLDALAEQGAFNVPYAVVVTDALEISRPWMVSRAPLFFVTDEASRQLVLSRYALGSGRVAACGFPVRRAFAPGEGRKAPTPDDIRIAYGAYAPLPRVREDVRCLLECLPGAHITLLAGERSGKLTALQEASDGRVDLLDATDDMAGLFARSHLYIGKAGAATMFEAYSSMLPVIVNYALPGQEQGNLALLLQDGAGVASETTADMMRQIGRMLENGAAGWQRMCSAMRNADRSGASRRIVDEAERRFFS